MRAQRLKRFWEALRFRNWAVATKITALLLSVVLITAISLTLFITQRAAQALAAEMRSTLQSMALGAARVLRGELDFALQEYGERQSAFLSELAQALAAPSEATELLLEEAIAFYEAYAAIQAVQIVDPSGVIVAALDVEQVGQPVEGELVGRALAGQAAFSAPRPDPQTFFPVTRLALPLRAGEVVSGALILTYSLNGFDFYLRDTLLIQQGEGSVRSLREARLYAVNPDGIVLFDSDPQRAWQYAAFGAPAEPIRAAYSAPGALGKLCALPNWDALQPCPSEQARPRPPLRSLPALQPLANLARQTVAQPQRGNVRSCRPEDLSAPSEGESCGGAPYLVAYAPLAAPPSEETWFVVFAELPESAIWEAIADQRASGFAVAALILPPAVLIALLLGRTIARPIQRLSAVAAEVERGRALNETIIRQVARRGDELGALARIFGAMVRALNARNEELHSIYQIGVRISSSLDLQETLAFVLTALRQAVPYDWAEISLYDAERRQIVPQVAADRAALQPATPQPVSAMHGYPSYLITQGDSLHVADIAAFEGALWRTGRSWDALAPRSYLGVALKSGDQLIGVIELVGSRADQLSADHLRLVKSVAVQAAVALQNAQQVQRREAELRREIQELRIEIDESKKARQVAAITESEYFQQLQSRVSQLRSRKQRADPSEGER